MQGSVAGNRRWYRVPVSVAAAVVFLCGVSSFSQGPIGQIAPLVSNGAVLLMDPSGGEVFSLNPDQLLIPASIIKLYTAAIATDILGASYRFETGFYTDSEGNLAIRGGGDPFLVSEEIDTIARRLKEAGVVTIRSLYLDHSRFESPVVVPGLSTTANPYNAINGALVVNFNTLNLRREADGSVVSNEPQTPLTPLARQRGRELRAGTRQRINLSSDEQLCRRYAGELFAGIFAREGIAIDDPTPHETTIDTVRWHHVYTHRNSRTLEELCAALQEYSNNFIANQIFLTVGASVAGYPATMEKGNAAFGNHLRQVMGRTPHDLVLVEGSGISRSNRATARAMMDLLTQRPHLAQMLPRRRGALAKSGTLSGVYNYAGYVATPRGNYPFVIILNQSANHRETLLDLIVAAAAAHARQGW